MSRDLPGGYELSSSGANMRPPSWTASLKIASNFLESTGCKAYARDT